MSLDLKSIQSSENATERAKIPKGYLVVTHRLGGHKAKSHLYSGGFNAVGVPMCKKAPTSILRNWLSEKGICLQCLKNANNGLTVEELLETLKEFDRKPITKNEQWMIDEYANSDTHRLYVVNDYDSPHYGQIAVTLKKDNHNETVT